MAGQMPQTAARPMVGHKRPRSVGLVLRESAASHWVAFSYAHATLATLSSLNPHRLCSATRTKAAKSAAAHKVAVATTRVVLARSDERNPHRRSAARAYAAKNAASHWVAVANAQAVLARRLLGRRRLVSQE